MRCQTNTDNMVAESGLTGEGDVLEGPLGQGERAKKQGISEWGEKSARRYIAMM